MFNVKSIMREFNKVLEKMDRRRGPNVKNISIDINRNNESQRKDRYNDVSKNESNNENSNHMTTLTRRYESHEEYGHEGVSCKEFVDSYKELCVRNEEVIKSEEKQKRIIVQLQVEKNKLLSANSDLQNEVTLLSSNGKGETYVNHHWFTRGKHLVKFIIIKHDQICLDVEQWF